MRCCLVGATGFLDEVLNETVDTGVQVRRGEVGEHHRSHGSLFGDRRCVVFSRELRSIVVDVVHPDQDLDNFLARLVFRFAANLNSNRREVLRLKANTVIIRKVIRKVLE